MYKIGKIIVDVKQFQVNINLQRLELFSCKNKTINVNYQIKYVDELPEINNFFYQNNQLAVAIKNNNLQYYHIWDNNIYAIVEECENKYTIYLEKGYLYHNLHPYFIPSLFHLEKPLLQSNCFILHSSYIEINNCGILFTAPSGGGKSTQAELWKKYKNALIINGDKSIIGKENGIWKTYGIPFSGSSNYCLNKTNKLGAIIILKKGLNNEIKRLDLTGFRNVFSQVTVNPWDKDFCNKLMDLVIECCENVPVYIFSCTKDEKAVDFLYNSLKTEGILSWDYQTIY